MATATGTGSTFAAISVFVVRSTQVVFCLFAVMAAAAKARKIVINIVSDTV
jgi:hypothetical protein